MNKLSEHIITFRNAFSSALAAASSLENLEQVRVTFLGRKSQLTDLMEQLKELSLEEKKEFGPLLNTIKQECTQQFEEKKQALEAAQRSAQENQERFFDVTAYLPNYQKGTLHPLTHIQEELTTIFISMGFAIADGPEVETEHYNFDALNIPSGHPARDMWDTLWLDVPGLLLRTHTSPVQIRTLEKYKAPLAIACPGRCYRHEATDASHDFSFMQLEALVVDEHSSLSHLLAVIKQFMQALFGTKHTDIRVRPSYFPFVEPGLEVDVQCPFCTQGCAVCKHSRWIEMGGAGLVHPHVLQAAAIDSTRYSAFAFGFGLTRLAMLKYGIHDIRLLHTSNITILKQF